MTVPILYDYYRSSAAYRVRIALNLKGIAYESRSINLVDNEQGGEAYRRTNPQGLIPALEIDGRTLTQSVAIILYLDQKFPVPPLLTTSLTDAAHVRAMALAIACDVHPLNNLRVLRYLKDVLGIDEPAREAWYAHWIAEAFAALETMAKPRAGRFLFEDTPSLADVLLVPQMYNARRFSVPLDAYPTLMRADASANELDPFAKAHPDRQEQSA